VEALCDAAGDGVEGARRRAFPPAAIVASMSEHRLRTLGMGFRAPYLRETARRVADRTIDLEELTGATTESARTQLMTLPGVGPKIADCVLLFAYGRQDVFPLDVWVSRVLVKHYRRGRALPGPRLRTWALRRFGPSAGYAQQYIFHYARSHPDRFRPSRTFRP
jgi:N-glycosylase/DNA lyase